MSQLLAEEFNKLACPSGFANNIEKDLPHLLNSVNGDSSEFSQVVKFLFGQDSVINHVSRSELENKLLRPTLLSFSNIFSLNLAKTLNILENAEGECDEDICITVSNVLQVCLDILGGYYDVLEYLATVSLLKSGEVETLIKTLPGILLEAFNYCHGSENSFGSYFALSTELLTSFFRKSYEVTCLFYKLLDEQITFDCSAENDVTILLGVIETLCSVGEIVVNLDAKSMVDQWKGIAKLITKYSNDLKDRLNLSQPLKFLISTLKKTIASVTDDQEPNNISQRNRNLKLGSFILKIIVKISELYCGYLDSCINDLVDLLFLLNRCSRLSKKSYNNDLERFIVVGAGPLLSHLVKDRQFIEAFQSSCGSHEDTKSVEEIIGLFYTHLRLLKFLINCNNSEVKENCIKIPLVPTIINLFSKCCKHLDLTIPIEDNDTYTTFISVSVAYVISSFSSEQFISLEEFLLRQLFMPDIEVGLLCSDILTLICRLTNEEVCLKITRYLFHALSQIDSYMLRPEACLVRVTAARLYSLLTRSGQDTIEREFPFSHAWRHVLFQSNEKVASIAAPLENSEISSQLEFMNMIETLHTVCSSGIKDIIFKYSLVDKTKRLLMGHKSCKSSQIQADWWYNSFYLLSKCVGYISPWCDSASLSEVLDIFLELVFLGQSPIFYYISGAMEKIFSGEIQTFNSNCDVNKAGNIFQLCLTSDNAVIKQIVVERFLSIERFNEISLLLQIDKGCQEYITSYAGKTPTVPSTNTLHSFHVDFSHKCSSSDYCIEDSPPNKKLKKDSSAVSAVIVKLKECVDNVINYAVRTPLSVEEKDIVYSSISSLKAL